MKKFICKSMLVSMSAAAFLTAVNPGIEAAQQDNSQNTNEVEQAQEQGNVKEVYTYEDFKNAKGPVAINPIYLSDEEMKNLNLNPETVKNNFGDGNSISPEKTRKWSGKVTKGQLSNATSSVGSVVTIISGALSLGSGATISSGAFSLIAQVMKGGKWHGVKVGGTKTQRLVRDNWMQKPKKKWIYKITWAKKY